MDKIRPKGGTEPEWLDIDPVLDERELAITMNSQNTPIGLKAGDGVHRWSELPYLTGGGGSSVPVVEIPKLILFKQGGQLYAKWNALNTEFLSYNPVISLFRYTKNSKRNKETKPYFNRPTSVKMRRITLPSTDIRSVEFTCPTESNSAQLMPIVIDEWVLDDYDELVYRGVKMHRKSRGTIRLSIFGIETAPTQQAQISVTFGLGIVIDNPDVLSGTSRIWQDVTPFKMSAYKGLDPITSEITIFKIVRLR